MEIVILCHVDDLLILGKNLAEIQKVFEEVSTKINLQELGEVSTFVGIEFSLEYAEKDFKRVEKHSEKAGYKSLLLHQSKYAKSLLKRFSKEYLTLVNTLVTKGVKL